MGEGSLAFAGQSGKLGPPAENFLFIEALLGMAQTSTPGAASIQKLWPMDFGVQAVPALGYHSFFEWLCKAEAGFSRG